MSAFIRIFRWSPAFLILLTTAVCCVVIWRGGLTAVVAWYMLLQAVPLLGILTLLGTGGYALWRRRMPSPVKVNLAIGVVALLPVGIPLGLFKIAYPASLENTKPAATVRLPADEPLLVGWGGDTPDVNYHVALPDQRWAYDLLVDPALGGSDSLDDYGCWGIPVLAPAAGKVVVARDGSPDLKPGEMDPLNPAGNTVGIRLATETYLVIGHLMKGSVAVKEGDDLEEGQLLGKRGNSGNTSEPHIHLHHQRQNPKEYPTGLAEGLPLFFRDHDGDPMPTGGLEVVDDKPLAKGVTVRHIGAR